MQIALLCCYPLLIHLAVQFNLPPLRAAAVMFLAGGILYKRLRNRDAVSWAVLIGVTLVTLAAILTLPTMVLFYLPPVALPALVGAAFARSLLPGQTPLVTAIGERARGAFDTPMRRYTKGVTIAWAVVLGAMALWSALLAWLAGDWLWSLVTNFVNYAIIGAMFIGEFILRKVCFRHHHHPRFREYLAIVFGSEGFNRRS